MITSFRGLPVIKFFEPNAKFFELMNKYPDDLTIYDVGAGVGHVSKELQEKGKQVVALDMFPRDYSYFPVTIADAERYYYDMNSILMFCRPCHGYFVENSINRSVMFGVKQIIYVGLYKNVEDDLGIYYEIAIEKANNVGKDNESFWTISL